MAGTTAEGEKEVPGYMPNDDAGGDPGDSCGCFSFVLLPKGAEINGVHMWNERWRIWRLEIGN